MYRYRHFANMDGTLSNVTGTVPEIIHGTLPITQTQSCCKHAILQMWGPGPKLKADLKIKSDVLLIERKKSSHVERIFEEKLTTQEFLKLFLFSRPLYLLNRTSVGDL